MIGFLKRDLFLQVTNLGFYLAFLAAMGIMTVFSDMDASFLFLYAMIFCASALASLFSYDEVNHWQAYAAAVPNGRRDQVRGRYTMALTLSVVVSAVLLAATLLGGQAENWSLALLYAGMLLVYVDVMFPLSYRFGSKSRLAMIILLAATAGIMGIGGSMLVLSGGPDKGLSPFNGAAVVLVSCGLVGMVVSYGISVAIMKRKEF